MISIPFTIGAMLAVASCSLFCGGNLYRSRPGFYKLLPWSRKKIRRAVSKDKSKNKLVSAQYYLDMILNSEYGKITMAQQELLHTVKENVEDALVEIDISLSDVDESLAGLQ